MNICSMRLRRIAAIAAATLVMPALTAVSARAQRPGAPAWTQGATCYEVFVRSFADSDGDGIGDLRGLLQRFDYINDGRRDSRASLGARCIWLMPIMASPSYHGYDISDYYRVQPVYGSMDDLKRVVALAHVRGVKVLLDMVINHTSSEHAFFQAALRDTASPYRAMYRFAPTPGPNNRWGDNNWRKSPLRDEYFFAFFYKGMPDLNYERPEALAEMKRVATFWLREAGVDGFRMDAVKFLVEDGGRVEDTPGTHEVLREYAAHVRRTKPGAFTIGEVFDGNNTLFTYYPNQLDSYFAFEVADSVIAGVRRGDARGVLSPILALQARLPASRWGTFLRNHDQPRTASELGGDLRKARLAALIQLTLPGLPFVYYGEELGMQGPKPDEQIRTPMAWNTSGPHAGFSTGTPWEPLRGDSLSANVEAQARDTASMLQLYRTLIHLRTQSSALSSGRLTSLGTNDPALLAYQRTSARQTVIVVANLSAAPVLPVIAPGISLTAGRSESIVARDLMSGASRSLRTEWRGNRPTLTFGEPLPGQTAVILESRAASAARPR